MEALAYHRDRAARHEGHYRIDCLSSAPKAVEVKSRRSIRHASKAQTREMAWDGYDEYLNDLEELAELAS